MSGLPEWHRATLLWKCSGLTADRLTLRSSPPSALSLLGLIRHLADAERAWFRRYFRGEQIPEGEIWRQYGSYEHSWCSAMRHRTQF